MPKKIREAEGKQQAEKEHKKKGRPKKELLQKDQRVHTPSKPDDIMVTKLAREAIQARRIQSLLDLY